MKKHIRQIILATVFAALGTSLIATGSLATSTVNAQTKNAVEKVRYEAVAAGSYSLDPAHSLIGFAVKHLEINLVEGRFKDFTGTINYNDQDPTKSTVEFSAKIASIDTEIAPRDEHLRSADFFDAAKFPEMTFKSTGIKSKGKNKYILVGDLTIKGVMRSVELPFTFTGAVKDPWGGTRFGIEAGTTINRRDFGINYGNALAAGGLDVGNEVIIKLRLEAVKQESKAAGGNK
jgi:polyisoprenoid-binding protein YceI